MGKYNVDELLAQPLEVTLGNQVFSVKPMTVRQFTSTQKAQKSFLDAIGEVGELEKQGDACITLILELSMGVIPQEELERLSVGQLMALVDKLGEFQKTTREDDRKNPPKATD